MNIVKKIYTENFEIKKKAIAKRIYLIGLINMSGTAHKCIVRHSPEQSKHLIPLCNRNKK